MIRLFRLQIRAILILLALVCSPVSAEIAMVVHPDNPMTDISLDNLKRIYLGKTTSFESGDAIVLTVNSKLNEEFYELVLNMSVKRVRKHWMKIVFEGVFATPPIAFQDLLEMKKFIGQNVGSIGFMDILAVDSTLKVLTIEGLSPGASGYPLCSDKLTTETE